MGSLWQRLGRAMEPHHLFIGHAIASSRGVKREASEGDLRRELQQTKPEPDAAKRELDPAKRDVFCIRLHPYKVAVDAAGTSSFGNCAGRLVSATCAALASQYAAND